MIHRADTGECEGDGERGQGACVCDRFEERPVKPKAEHPAREAGGQGPAERALRERLEGLASQYRKAAILLRRLGTIGDRADVAMAVLYDTAATDIERLLGDPQ